MPNPQNDPTMQLIRPNNVMFGTVYFAANFNPDVVATYALLDRQMPSMYLGAPPNGNDTARLRPFHASGFTVQQRAQRVYYLLAESEPTQFPNNLNQDVVTNNGNTFHAEKLGTTYNEITTNLIQITNRWITSATLTNANANQLPQGYNVGDVVQIVDGQLAGTFWCVLRNTQRNQEQFYPMEVMDWSAAGLASTDDFPAGIQQDPDVVHWGHYAINQPSLFNFYMQGTPNLAPDVLSGLFNLGRWEQLYNQQIGEQQFASEPLMSGFEYLSCSQFTSTNNQFTIIGNMIRKFES